jgi:hypothetical protein
MEKNERPEKPERLEITSPSVTRNTARMTSELVESVLEHDLWIAASYVTCGFGTSAQHSFEACVPALVLVEA